jgi:putative hydrolase of the HAD superfamily
MPEKPNTPVIWCDFGGVLTAPATETLPVFCLRVGVDPPKLVGAMRVVAARYGTADIMEPLDTPMVAASDWAGEVEQVLAAQGVTVHLDDFAAHWFAGRPANTELVDYLMSCKNNGLFVGMLSNMVPAFEPHWPRMVDPAVFDDFVFSYRVGMRKPDRRIYNFAAGRAGARPADCLLIDDLPENCAGAREAGWSALEFTSTAEDLPRLRDLVTELSRRNLSPAGSE